MCRLARAVFIIMNKQEKKKKKKKKSSASRLKEYNEVKEVKCGSPVQNV